MTSVPSNPVDVPPFQIQRLISGVVGRSCSNTLLPGYRCTQPLLFSGGQFEVLCAQAFGASHDKLLVP